MQKSLRRQREEKTKQRRMHTALCVLDSCNLLPLGKSDFHCPAGGWVGLGWVSARTTGSVPRPVRPYLTGTTVLTFGCLVSQLPRLLMIPKPHQGAGEREIPPCLCVLARAPRAWGGGVKAQSQAQWHTFVLLQQAVVHLWAGGRGCVCLVHQAPAEGRGCPTTRLLVECVGQVTCSFLQPTTEAQWGAWGVWSEVLPD